MIAAMSGLSSAAIVAGDWPARQRRPVSSVMVWKTQASAVACTRRSSGFASPAAGIMAAAIAPAWRSVISRLSRRMAGLTAASEPSPPRT